MSLFTVIVDILKASPMTREELKFELELRRLKVSDEHLRHYLYLLKKPRLKRPKQVYIKGWVQDPASDQPDRYRAVFAYGAFADAKRPKSKRVSPSDRPKRRKGARVVVRPAASVWDFAAMKFADPNSDSDSLENSASV